MGGFEVEHLVGAQGLFLTYFGKEKLLLVIYFGIVFEDRIQGFKLRTICTTGICIYFGVTSVMLRGYSLL